MKNTTRFPGWQKCFKFQPTVLHRILLVLKVGNNLVVDCCQENTEIASNQQKCLSLEERITFPLLLPVFSLSLSSFRIHYEI